MRILLKIIVIFASIAGTAAEKTEFLTADFSITPPKGWAQKEGQPMWLAKLDNPNGAAINVTVEAAKVTLNEYEKRLSDGLARGGNDFSVVKRSEFKTDSGLTGFKLLVKWTTDAVPWWARVSHARLRQSKCSAISSN